MVYVALGLFWGLLCGGWFSGDCWTLVCCLVYCRLEFVVSLFWGGCLILWVLGGVGCPVPGGLWVFILVWFERFGVVAGLGGGLGRLRRGCLLASWGFWSCLIWFVLELWLLAWGGLVAVDAVLFCVISLVFGFLWVCVP